MKCPKCGTETEKDAKFCGTCGQKLEEVASTPENNSSTLAEGTTVQDAPPIETPNDPINDVLMQPGLNNSPTSVRPTVSKTAIFVAIGAIVITLIAIIAFIILLPNNEEKKAKESINNKFNPEKLIAVKKDNNYGYINTKGKMVIEAKYEAASEFYGNHAIVRTEAKVDGVNKSVYQIIDKNGKVKKQAEGNIKYLSESDMWIIEEKLYNSSMKKISPNDVRVQEADENYFVWVNSKKNTGGIMNSEGKITYTYKFQTGEDYINIEPSEVDETLKETYCRVNIENEKFAIVNCDNGKVVYDFTPKYIAVDDDNIFEINKLNSYTDEAYIYFQNDKIVYQTTVPAHVSIRYYPGYLSISDSTKAYSDGRYTYLNLKTMEIKSERPTDSNEETADLDEWEKYTGYKELYQNGKYGLSKDTEIILKAEWDRLEYLNVDLYKYLKANKKDYIYARKDNSWYLVNLKDQKPVHQFKTSYIYPNAKSTFMYYTDKETNNKKVFNLLSEKTLNIPSGTYLSVYSNYITVKDNSTKNLKYYNTDLELIYTENN
ncbi:MAG: WG repeat-containing protein [Mycoplasmatota bacterium]|nr:WG repeat-containing protein [Mycoplasmatota bacterium]